MSRTARSNEAQRDTLHEVRVCDVAPRGDAEGELAGRPTFVAGAIPGELVRVRIRRHRRTWTSVELVEVVEPSPDRVAPRCPLFSLCAGCQFQHIAYPRQLELKHRLVQRQLAQFPVLADALVLPVLGAADPWAYRNHARFTVSAGRLGFVRVYRRQFLDVPHCPIMEPRVNELLAALQGRLEGASQCNLRVGPGTEISIQPNLERYGLQDIPSGQPYLWEELGGRRFRVSAASFFQVNRAQAERLVELVIEAVQPDPSSIVVDAFAGVGTFAALLAPHVGWVVAIEESGPAVEDARINTEGLTNVELRLGKTEAILPALDLPMDALVLDPPRAGCHPDVLDAVARSKPARIVYVSCEPSTLARDLALLVAGGYVVERVQPIDMFPHTHHVECVAILRR